jgi:hypothetical protein
MRAGVAAGVNTAKIDSADIDSSNVYVKTIIDIDLTGHKR